MRLRSTQTRVFVGSAPYAPRYFIAVQCVVALYPFNRPAAPRTSDPVQTDVTYFACADCARTKSSTSSSLTMSSVPAPPGTQITSSGGQSAKLMVGNTVSTVSLATGSIRFPGRCTGVSGQPEE